MQPSARDPQLRALPDDSKHAICDNSTASGYRCISHTRNENAIALLVLALLCYALQAGLWVRPTTQAHSETDKANILEQRQPNEIPAVMGTVLLIAAAVVASVPQSTRRAVDTGVGAHHL